VIETAGSSHCDNLARLLRVLRWQTIGFLITSLGVAAQSAGCQGAGDVDGRPAPSEGGLAPGVAARVGTTDVSLEAVRAVVGAENAAPREARSRLINDALYAAEAHQRFAGTGIVDTARRAAHARALLDLVRAEALAAGPPTPEEMVAASEGRWVEFDRPSAVQVRHAVAIFKKDRDKDVARAVAERIATAVRGAQSADEFMALAKTVDGGKIKIAVETLPPVTHDGRTFEPPRPGRPARVTGNFAHEFAAAAHAIKNEGGLSPVALSPFGFHVIYLEKRLAAQHMPEDEKATLLREEIVLGRAEAIVEKIVAEQAELHPVVQERSADALTATIEVAR
jgi:hypothetical protein